MATKNEVYSAWPFWNARERRLRAAVRVYLQLLLRSLLFAAIGVPGAVLVLEAVASSPGGFGELGPAADSLEIRLATSVAAVSCTILSVYVCGRFLDRRPFSSFGLKLTREWWLDCLFGFALGGVLMGGVFAAELAAGWSTVTGTFEGGWGSPFLLLAPPVVFVCAGFWEELLYRGYALKNLSEGLNARPLRARGAVLLSWFLVSVAFGVGHLGNPGADALAVANIVAAGLMLGLPYVLTGDLAVPIGLHVGWNLFQNAVFGMPVSGIEPAGATVFSVDRTGPALATGGSFGPEGGMLGLLAIGAGCAAILGWARLKGCLFVSEDVARPNLVPTSGRTTSSAGGDQGAS